MKSITHSLLFVSGARVHNAKLGLGPTRRCECGNCAAMDKVEECNCCTESHEIMQKLTSHRPQEKPDIRCITQLVGFQSVCLDPDAVQTAYYQYKEEHGAIQKITEEKYHYIGYRQLVRWC